MLLNLINNIHNNQYYKRLRIIQRKCRKNRQIVIFVEKIVLKY